MNEPLFFHRSINYRGFYLLFILFTSVLPTSTLSSVADCLVRPQQTSRYFHLHPLILGLFLQVYYKGRRDSRSHASPERRPSAKEPSPSKFPRLPRQSTAIDESGPGPWGRRGSQPTLSPDLPAASSSSAAAADDSSGRKARRDSLSPDSASYTHGRRDSRSHLSPDRTGTDRDVSPVGRGRRGRLRRQSTSITGGAGCRGMPPRSPESSSTCSSRDPSPCNRAPPAPTSHAPVMIRRQSTTEEILIARGFRRQSTTEEMIRCRNFRRQSSQSEDLSRSRGRRDSSAQIIDGTFATMTVETTSTFFDTSTQTGEFHRAIQPLYVVIPHVRNFFWAIERYDKDES
jgi:hypothetical protein